MQIYATRCVNLFVLLLTLAEKAESISRPGGVNKPAWAMEAGGVNKPAGGVYKPAGPAVNG